MRLPPSSRSALILLTAGLVAPGATVSCASRGCVSSHGVVVVSVRASSGGDAPGVQTMRLYQDGRLELENPGETGTQVFCSRVSGRTVLRIAAEMSSQDFRLTAAGLPGVAALCCDRALAFVTTPERQFVVDLEQVPPTIVPFLVDLDTIFSTHFRPRYRGYAKPRHSSSQGGVPE
jgi:hypothetical protein